jgi:hypothetical protein
MGASLFHSGWVFGGYLVRTVIARYLKAKRTTHYEIK